MLFHLSSVRMTDIEWTMAVFGQGYSNSNNCYDAGGRKIFNYTKPCICTITFYSQKSHQRIARGMLSVISLVCKWDYKRVF